MTTWVLFAGPPGVGKSTLAHAVERRINDKRIGSFGMEGGAVTLDKDQVRAALFPGKLTDYTQQQDDLCMGAILQAAAYLTERSGAAFVLLDGRTFSRSTQIETVIAAAAAAGARWRIVRVSCPDEVAEARLAAESQKEVSGAGAHPAENRDAALYRKIKREFEPIHHPKLDVDSTQPGEANVDAVLRYLAHFS